VPLSHDPAFQGPIAHRKCRDILFLLLFIAFWVLIAQIYMTTVDQVGLDGWKRIVYPVDTHGRYCGKPADDQGDAIPFYDTDNRETGFEDWDTYMNFVDPAYDVANGHSIQDLSEQEYLWFPVADDLSLDTCICVTYCPGDGNAQASELLTVSDSGYWCSRDFALFLNAGNVSGEDKTLFSYPDGHEGTSAFDDNIFFILGTDFTFAKSGQSATIQTIMDLECKLIVYRSQTASYSYHRCMPFAQDLIDGISNISDIASSISSFIGDSANSAAIAELASAWRIMVAGCVLAVLFAFFWLVLLRIAAKFIVWITLLGVLGVGCLASYVYLTAYLDEVAFCDAGSCSDTKLAQINKQMYVAYGVTGVTVVYTLMLLCCIKRINLAIDVVLEAARAIAALPWLVLTPVLFVVVGFVIVLAVAFVASLVYSSGDLTINTGGHRQFDLSDMQLAYIGILLLAALWGAYFVSGISQVTIAGAVATYYWRKDKRAPLRFTILRSFFRAIFFHLGSIALGSFLIACVTWIRIVFQYVKRKAMQANPNGAIKYIMGCVDCLLACFERFLKYVNRNAYIQIAVYGDNFCKSAKRAIQLIFRNIVRLTALNAIGDALLFLGKIFVALAASVCTAAFIIYADTDFSYLGTVEYWQIPAVVVFVFGFIFGSMFFNVTEMAVDTIMQCFLEDSERNDGTATRPYYAPASLRRYI
jgi:hypothetical protein